MRKIIFIVFIVLCLNTEAQVTFEHDYDSASTFASGNPAVSSQLMIVNFEVSGERYVNINRWGKYISIYEMNHSLQKIISLSSFPMNSTGAIGEILYFSENLFNTDSKIEFIYVTNFASTDCYTYIYNENGTLIFSEPASPIIRSNVPLQQYPIYNTTYGTKMILSYPNGHAKVFSLPGKLTTGVAEANGLLMQQSGQLSKLYPNPSNGAVTLQYELPNGETEGELILYNMQGMEVKRYKIDNTFSDILLDNTQLPAGTYFYQLQTSKGAVGTKKMVIIK
jgi:hypothetical protein